MKHLKNPYFPLAILFIILSAFGYRSFFDTYYTETEKQILGHNYHQNLSLKYENMSFADKIRRKTKDKFMEDGAEENEQAKKMYESVETKMNKLNKIYENIQTNYFEKPRLLLREEEKIPNTNQTREKFPPNIETPKIVTVINEYIQKASQLDSSIAILKLNWF